MGPPRAPLTRQRTGPSFPVFHQSFHILRTLVQVIEVLVSVGDLDVRQMKRSMFPDQSRLQRAARRVTASFGRGFFDLAELRGRWFASVAVSGLVDGPLPAPTRDSNRPKSKAPIL